MKTRASTAETANSAADSLPLPALMHDGAGVALAMVVLALLPGGLPIAELDRLMPWTGVFSLLTVVAAWALGCYRRSRPAVPGFVLRLLGVLGFSIAIFRLLPWPWDAVSLLAWQAPLVVAALYAARLAGEGALPHRLPRRLLVLGQGPQAQAVQRAVASAPDIRFAGIYPVGPQTGAAGLSLSAAIPLDRTVRDLGVTDIVVALSERRGGMLPQDALLACRLRGVRVHDLSSFFEREHGQLRLDALRAGWLIFGEGFRQGRLRECVKRVFDILFASVLLLGAAPLMGLTAIAIVLDSPGPVFYRQQRVGRDGRVFEVIKFRSMRSDAERDGTPRWAASGDSRITRVGQIIRRFRIDELPQLWNVLRGDMSLVGPRPERPFFVSTLTEQVPFYAIRHSVKPGLTGWAQVRYHYGESVEDAVEKLQYDLYYLKHNGLLLDLKILMATVRVVLTGQGAH